MKKQILLTYTAVLSISLMAFSFINNVEPNQSIESTDPLETKRTTSTCTDPANINYVTAGVWAKDYSDFFYDLSPRFEGMKKSEIEKATTVFDFSPDIKKRFNIKYGQATVIVIINDKQTDIRETSEDEVFNDKQLKLLRSAKYSTHFLVRAEFREKNYETGEWDNNYVSPHFTVIPEKQARYTPGKAALLEYIKVHNKENTANLDESLLQPAKLSFTVTKTGSITNVALDRTSGYSFIDQTMIQLISLAPGQWEPAENAQGQKVDQVLVISFGMFGC